MSTSLALPRAYAPGREERIAKAQAKRERKNIKRKVDAFNSAVGQLRAYEEQTLALYRMLSRGA